MDTLTLRGCALGLALSGCAALTSAYAGDPAHRTGEGSKQSDIGAVTGIAVGALAAGPIGAALGGAAGALVGDRFHRQAQSSAALTEDLRRSEAQRAELAAELARTDQLGLDVSFRTGDDSVAAQAMPALLKLGALAASLPQAQLCVAGFADPRGTDAYNDELSLRRAANVAAVLTSAGEPRERIRIEGHGKTEAGDANGDLDAYALERRVTVRLQLAAATEVAARD